MLISLKKLETFSGGPKYAYTNEALARHFVHKILMKSLEGEDVMKQEEQEFELLETRRRPDM